MRLERQTITFHLPLTIMLLLLLVSRSTLVHAQHDEPITDKETKLLHFARMEYPTLARTALVQGVVVVRARLDDKGSVVDADALSGAEALVSACLSNAKEWRFKPNSKGAVVIVYNFRIIKSASVSGCKHFAVEPPNLATITACAPQIQ